jgi:hypothetical protein
MNTLASNGLALMMLLRRPLGGTLVMWEIAMIRGEQSGKRRLYGGLTY